MDNEVKIYTFDDNTIYDDNCIIGSNIELYVEGGSTGATYVSEVNESGEIKSGFDGNYTMLYTTFNINLQDISTQCVIGEGAFQNHNELTTLEIPTSVVQIGEKAFNGCDNLISVSLPFVGESKNSTETFGWVFNNETIDDNGDIKMALPPKLTTVTINGDITTIIDNAFKNAKQLTNINLPTSITKIGEQAFYNTGVVNLIIPDNVVELGEGAFHNMTMLNTVSWYTKNYELKANENVLTSYLSTTYFDDISTIDKIYGYQFIKNESTSANEFYGTEPFVYDENKHDVDTNGLVSLKDSSNDKIAFAPIVSRLFDYNVSQKQGKCGDNLEYTIEPIEDASNNYRLKITGYGEMRDFIKFEEELSNEEKLNVTPWNSEVNDIIEIQLPNRITSIGDYAFANLSNVKKIILPQSITKIGKYAFSHCEKAQFLDDKEGYQLNLLRLEQLKTIGENAFEYCKELREFNCDENEVLSRIDKYAFRNCENLTTVILPNKDIYLEESMFFNCDNIQKLSIPISSDIGKGENNDFTKFSQNYRKYNIGGFFKTYHDEDTENQIDVTFEGDIGDKTTTGWISTQFASLIEANVTYFVLERQKYLITQIDEGQTTCKITFRKEGENDFYQIDSKGNTRSVQLENSIANIDITFYNGNSIATAKQTVTGGRISTGLIPLITVNKTCFKLDGQEYIVTAIYPNQNTYNIAFKKNVANGGGYTIPEDDKGSTRSIKLYKWNNLKSPTNINNYIQYNCWFTGYSYGTTAINCLDVVTGTYTNVSQIINLYVPISLKDITIRNGVMPQFYLYIGDSEQSEWTTVKLEEAVEQTIYFKYDKNNYLNGFSNTRAIQTNEGLLVGVIAKNIEIYNIASQTFYNGDGLLGFNSNSNSTATSGYDFNQRNTLCASKSKLLWSLSNNYYRYFYSYSTVYERIVCKGTYASSFVDYRINNVIIKELNLESTSLVNLTYNLFNKSMEIINLYLPKTVTNIEKMNVMNINSTTTSTKYLNIQNIHQNEGAISTIAASAFKDNLVLQQFNCKIKMNIIPSMIFSGCKSLKLVKEIEGNNICISDSSFYECYGLEEINFNLYSTVETVQQYAFKNCSLLRTLLPCSSNGLKVYHEAFYRCKQLIFKCLERNNTVKITELNGVRQFYECTKLQQVKFSDTLTAIPDSCFYNCALVELRVPDTITSIEQQAFEGYKGVWVELPQLSTRDYTVNGEKYYGLSYYLGDPTTEDGKPNTNLKEVYISNSINIPPYAFQNWETLENIYFKAYKEGEETLLNHNNFKYYFSSNDTIPWDSNDTSFTLSATSGLTKTLILSALTDSIFSFDWFAVNQYDRDYFAINYNGKQIAYASYNASQKSGSIQLALKKGEEIQIVVRNYYRNSDSGTISNMVINSLPCCPDSALTGTNIVPSENFLPYPNDLPWDNVVAGVNRMRFLSVPFASLKNPKQCMYLDYNKEYLWKILLYSKQYDVYITDNNTYTEQYSYLPKLYTPNHNGIEVGQHIELQGENTYKITKTQQFKHTGKIYYRQSQGVVSGKISYYSVNNGTLTYNIEQDIYTVDEELKKVLSSYPVEFSTGSTYEQSLYKGKISLIGNVIHVELNKGVTEKEFEFGEQIALKQTVVQKATLKSELLSVVKKDTRFVVANSNQLQTVTDINEFYEITIKPGFTVNTTGYDEIGVTLADETRILSHDIHNNEIIMVVNTKGNLYIEGNLGEEVKKGKVDEHLVSLVVPKNNSEVLEPTYFELDNQKYIITKVDVLNNIIYFENEVTNAGYIVNNQIAYNHEIKLQNTLDLTTDNNFDAADLHLTLNYINIFEVDTIEHYPGVEAENRELFGLKDGEELYLIRCKDVVNPTNYEVISRDLEKEAVMERYSTILTVETLEGLDTQHLLVAPNTNYYIYSNNIKTPPYHFETLIKQDVEMFYRGDKLMDNSLEMICGSGLFEAQYEGNITSATWTLKELYMDEYIEIDKLTQYSPNLFYNYHLFKDNTTYQLTLTIISKEGLIINKNINIDVQYPEIPDLSFLDVQIEKDCVKQAIKINLMDINLKVKEDTGYKICPRSWLVDENVPYKVEGLYIIRENLDEHEEDAVVTFIKGFPSYVYDYSFQREDTYRYSIIPVYHEITEEDRDRGYYIEPSNLDYLFRGVPCVIKPDIQFNTKTIVLIGTEMDIRENVQKNELLSNNYQADKQPFTQWQFKYNTEARSVNIMTDKTVFETISQFATVNYTARNYKTGTITAFLGSFHKTDEYSDWTYKDSIRLQNKFQEFANNGKIKMLRDEIGNVIPVDITLKSFEYNTHTKPTSITVSFEWTQVDTEKKLTVFEVEDN